MRGLSRPGRVRDPSHGYVGFTGLERGILDHPVAQRLRHISQSGMAQLVFPEVRSTRFAHSLGAMHLASRFFATALRNAAPEERDDIQKRLKAAVVAEWGMGMPQQAREQTEQLLSAHGLQSGGTVADEYRPYALLVEQALRLAALFHDLGHLPFSHDFEYALQAAIRRHRKGGGEALPTLGAASRLAIHEEIGYRLASLLQRQIFGQLQPPQKWVEISFLLAEKILNARTELDPDRPPALGGPADEIEGLYQWLHSFIAGELDVDRCDYILRDTRHYGLDFASFDLDRLVDNVVVCRSEAVPDALFNSVLPQGQSALESFVIARYRMHQWGIFHHKVQQAAAALQKTTRDMLAAAIGGDDAIARFLADIEAIAAADDPDRFLDDHAAVLDRYASYDDVWWMMLMRERAAGPSADAWVQLVCRRTHGPESLWKRRLEFPSHGEIERFNRGLPGASDEQQVAWEQAVDELEQDRVLVLRHRFQPWKSKNDADETCSALTIRGRDGGTIALSELSHLVGVLRDSWMQDVQVQAFSEREGLIEAEEVVRRLSRTMDDPEAE